MIDIEKVEFKKRKNMKCNLDVEEVKALILRVTGKKDYADIFEIRKTEDSVYDSYKLFDEGDKIIIEANNGIAACVAFNKYLQNVCKCFVGPVTRNMNLPDKPPQVGRIIENKSKFLYRYCMNYVTYSYTCAYYNWDDFEKLSDWMLLSGVNLLLNPIGFEIVWRDFLMSIGYSEKEAVDNITDPAHFPWQWMGNMSAYGGNLPDWWFENQRKLGNKLTDKIRSFGGDVIYPGFCGKMPVNIKEKYPLLKIAKQDDWCAVGERPSVVHHEDSQFDEFAQKFYEASIKNFGVSNYYSGDPFHEGGVTTGIHLPTFTRRMIDCMKKTNENAVWIFQGWSGNPKEEVFDYIHEDEVITVFLSADRFYKSFKGFGNSPWLYCGLFSFGGNLRFMGNLYGNLCQTYEANSNEYMIGIGFANECIEMDEMMFDTVAYTSIRSEKPSLDEFLDEYISARYGYSNENIKSIYKSLIDNIYLLYEERAFKASKISPFCGIPDLKIKSVGFFESKDDTPYDIKIVQNAAKNLLEEYDKLHNNECYRLDLMHLARQANADIAWEYIDKMKEAYLAKNKSEFEKYVIMFLKLFDLQDSLMANSSMTMFGARIKRAVDYGKTESEKRYFAHSFKDLITLWCGEKGRYALHDYSAREWSGILRNYYKQRWDAYLTMLMVYMDKPEEMPVIDWTEHSLIYSFSNEEYKSIPHDTLKSDVIESMNYWTI